MLLLVYEIGQYIILLMVTLNIRPFGYDMKNGCFGQMNILDDSNNFANSKCCLGTIITQLGMVGLFSLSNFYYRIIFFTDSFMES